MVIEVYNAKTLTVRLRGGLTEPEKNTASGNNYWLDFIQPLLQSTK